MQHTALKHHILQLRCNIKSTIRCPFILIKSKNILPLHLKHAISISTQTYKRFYKHNSTSPFIQYFLLIIYEITKHTTLKYRILYLKNAKMHFKVYHSIPLHTYTSNFVTSSTLQEIL